MRPGNAASGFLQGARCSPELQTMKNALLSQTEGTSKAAEHQAAIAEALAASFDPSSGWINRLQQEKEEEEGAARVSASSPDELVKAGSAVGGKTSALMKCIKVATRGISVLISGCLLRLCNLMVLVTTHCYFNGPHQLWDPAWSQTKWKSFL